MDISIIGAGSIGGTLAGQLAQRGHAVSIANSRGPASLASLAAQTGAVAAETTVAVARAQLLIVSVPMGALPGLGEVVGKHLPGGAVVVDTNNYVPEYRDEHIPAIDDGLAESLWVARQLRRPVIKAFNTLAAASLSSAGRPRHDAGRIAAPVSGDDEAAKQRVIDVLDELGFDGFDAGDLANSWRQQPGTPVFTADLPLEQARKGIEAATPEGTLAWRARMAALKQR